MMKDIKRDRLEVTGEITGGDEYRIDPHTDPGAIFIDNVDLIRMLDVRGYDDEYVKATITTDSGDAYKYEGILSVFQGYGDEHGYGIERDRLSIYLEEHDADVDLLKCLLQQAGWIITFTCEKM